MSSFFYYIKCFFSDKSDYVLYVNKQNGENVLFFVYGFYVKIIFVIVSSKKG